ncbi:hypothetical protein F4802DRAFT_611451 [Xylaria palmicola]|nr:hypothetical protein F4802DRAFT_611451 [Xylaria palmicola]
MYDRAPRRFKFIIKNNCKFNYKVVINVVQIGDQSVLHSILQMAVKALNDIAGLNSLVLTLFVFGAYLRINKNSPPSLTLVQRAAAIQKAMKMLRKNQAIKDSDVIVASINRPIRFRCTQVKPYYRTKDNRTTNVKENNIRPIQPTIARKKHGQPKKEPATNLLYKGQTAKTFLAQKKQQALELAIKLRTDRIITTPSKPFKESDATEINELVAQGIFKFITYNPAIHDKKHVFKSRLIQEVKRKNTKLYKKLKLVVQGYNNTRKTSCELQDITQTYVQLTNKLSRDIFAYLPLELKDKYPFKTILQILRIQVFTYNPCLLYTNNSPNTFRITGIQTDNTFKEKELQRTNFRMKLKETLLYDHLIDTYISSVCQLKATYNFAIAAQVTKLQSYNVKALNKRIKWQKDNLTKSLIFIPLNFCCTKLFIFTDSSFANNLNLTLQLGFIIVLATNILASELYSIVNGFNSTIALRTTFKNIIEALNLPLILTVLCLDLKSLYNCLVKLGTIQEKRLMINIISL